MGAAHKLEHLYRHPNMFTRQCVELVGAGSRRVNGLYERREAHEGPPDAHHRYKKLPFGRPALTAQEWIKFTDGRPWYQHTHNTSCYIYYSTNYYHNDLWACCDCSEDSSHWHYQ